MAIHVFIASSRTTKVEPGFCEAAKGLAAIVRNIEYLEKVLAHHDEESRKESARLGEMIAGQKTLLARTEAGLDLEKISLAEGVMYAGDYSRGGADRDSARRDAIKWFATGRAGYRGLQYEYFGTKSYDRWHGQRTDCEYGYGPRHGSMIFQIGLKREARARDLSDAEREACVYYLVNLERIQSAKAKA